ncbi:MAG: RnfABCDGE type electron transport complex subunit D [Pseudomonadota bacterium]
MRFKTVSSPHKLGRTSVNTVMLKVIAALLPGTAVATAWFGWGVLSNLVLAIGVALVAEALTLAILRRPVLPRLADLSAVVTAWLLALALPAYSPWWLILVGTVFAIVFAKQLYGGLGYNPFNPAMVGYVVLLISFPVYMTQWPEPALGQWPMDLGETLRHVFGERSQAAVDALTGATALDYSKLQLGREIPMDEVRQHASFGQIGASGWEWIAGAYALGGLALIAWRVMPWHAPVAMLASLFLLAELFHLIDPSQYHGGWFHWFSGGALMGAFFIVTDPVSGCTSNRGRLYFGVGAGVLVFVIRAWGGYPDGVAFAVLLMNMMAPMIDHYTKTRVFGTGGTGRPYGQ